MFLHLSHICTLSRRAPEGDATNKLQCSLIRPTEPMQEPSPPASAALFIACKHHWICEVCPSLPPVARQWKQHQTEHLLKSDSVKTAVWLRTQWISVNGEVKLQEKSRADRWSSGEVVPSMGKDRHCRLLSQRQEVVYFLLFSLWAAAHKTHKEIKHTKNTQNDNQDSKYSCNLEKAAGFLWILMNDDLICGSPLSCSWETRAGAQTTEITSADARTRTHKCKHKHRITQTQTHTYEHTYKHLHRFTHKQTHKHQQKCKQKHKLTKTQMCKST